MKGLSRRRARADEARRIDPYYPVPTTVPPALVALGEELSRVEESARWSAQCQFEQAKFWRGWNLKLGIPAFALGAASGATVLGDYAPDWVVGTLALLGATLAGVLTILGAERRSDRATADGNAFHEIQGDARQLLLVDLATIDPDEARGRLDEINRRYAETRRSADPAMRRCYERARDNIREGGQSFGVDRATAAAPPPAPVPPTLIKSSPTTNPPARPARIREENHDG